MSLKSHLRAATSTLDLARRLGEVCISQGGDIADLLEIADAAVYCDFLEQLVASMDHEPWMHPGPEDDFTHVLSAGGLREAIEMAGNLHPLECLGVLRGLCHRVLPRIYSDEEQTILLDRGTPVRFATRPVHKLFRATPYEGTMMNGHLLERRGFWLFQHAGGEKVKVVLDFKVRERLDELTWVDDRRLPKITTLHPCLSESEMDIGELTDAVFFCVKPKIWSLERVLDQLRLFVRDAEIAVLPELSLPEVDALESALAQDPSGFPPLVIAGSAHLREQSPAGTREIRANESRIYLDGNLVAAHRKIHPFELRRWTGVKLKRPLLENLTNESKTITVLSGTRTRLAVLICADLNDLSIPPLLEGAGVNLLLVPALTADEGAFNGGICGLASRHQGVSVIANAGFPADDHDPKESDGEGAETFLLMAAVPRPDVAEQSRGYPTPPEGCPCVALIDPNKPLDRAVIWNSSN